MKMLMGYDDADCVRAVYFSMNSPHFYLVFSNTSFARAAVIAWTNIKAIAFPPSFSFRSDFIAELYYLISKKKVLSQLSKHFKYIKSAGAMIMQMTEI